MQQAVAWTLVPDSVSQKEAAVACRIRGDQTSVPPGRESCQNCR